MLTHLKFCSEPLCEVAWRAGAAAQGSSVPAQGALLLPAGCEVPPQAPRQLLSVSTSRGRAAVSPGGFDLHGIPLTPEDTEPLFTAARAPLEKCLPESFNYVLIELSEFFIPEL